MGKRCHNCVYEAPIGPTGSGAEYPKCGAYGRTFIDASAGFLHNR